MARASRSRSAPAFGRHRSHKQRRLRAGLDLTVSSILRRKHMLMKRACASVLATIIGLIGVRQAIGENLCRPELTINEVEFSAMMPPTLERTWSAVVAVDASACTENSKGYFEMVFTRLSENAPDLEFRKQFLWSAPSFVWQAS